MAAIRTTSRIFDKLRRGQLSLQQTTRLLEQCILNYLSADAKSPRSDLLRFYDAYFRSETKATEGGTPIHVAVVSTLDQIAQLIPETEDNFLQQRYHVARMTATALLWERGSQRMRDQEDLNAVTKAFYSLQAIVDQVVRAAKRINRVQAMITKSELAKRASGLVILSVGQRTQVKGQATRWLTNLAEMARAGTIALEDERRHYKALTEGFLGANKFYAHTSERLCELVNNLGRDRKSRKTVIDLLAELIYLFRLEDYSVEVYNTMSRTERRKAMTASRALVKDRLRKMLSRATRQ